MPRRLTPLGPASDPVAEFAADLRDLRDRAGVRNPANFSVDSISRRTGVSRQTIYAALNGRIPNRTTLAKIVEAWGGDVAVWMRKRAAVEDAVAKGNQRTAAPSSPRKPHRARDHDERVKEQKRFWAERYGEGLQDVPSSVAAASPDLRQFAADLDRLRTEAGMSLRAIEREAGTGGGRGRKDLPVTTLSYILRGLRFPRWYQIEKLVKVLGGSTDEWRVKWVAMARNVGLAEGLVKDVELGPFWYKKLSGQE